MQRNVAGIVSTLLGDMWLQFEVESSRRTLFSRAQRSVRALTLPNTPSNKPEIMGAEGQRGRGAVDDVDGSLDKKTPLTSTNFCSKSRPCRVDRESQSSPPNPARTQPPGNEFARWMTPPPPPPPSLTVHVANRGLPGSRQGIIPRRASDIEISRTFIVHGGASPEKTIAPSRLARFSGFARQQ